MISRTYHACLDSWAFSGAHAELLQPHQLSNHLKGERAVFRVVCHSRLRHQLPFSRRLSGDKNDGCVIAFWHSPSGSFLENSPGHCLCDQSKDDRHTRSPAPMHRTSGNHATQSKPRYLARRNTCILMHQVWNSGRASISISDRGEFQIFHGCGEDSQAYRHSGSRNSANYPCEGLHLPRRAQSHKRIYIATWPDRAGCFRLGFGRPNHRTAYRSSQLVEGF